MTTWNEGTCGTCQHAMLQSPTGVLFGDELWCPILARLVLYDSEAKIMHCGKYKPVSKNAMSAAAYPKMTNVIGLNWDRAKRNQEMDIIIRQATKDALGYTMHRLTSVDEGVTASDLLEEIAAHPDAQVEAYRVTVYDKAGPKPEQIEMVIFDGDRAGIAWGADADWTDCDDPEDAIQRYLGIGGKTMIN